MSKQKIKTLSKEQYDLLNKIANLTDMSVWFSIYQDKDSGIDYIYDTEEKEFYTLKAGVASLLEGIDSFYSLESLELSDIEIDILRGLCNSLELDFNY